MNNVYVVVYGNEKGGCGEIKGVFLKKEDAQKAAKGFGFWGSDGYVLSKSLYENYEEYENNE